MKHNLLKSVILSVILLMGVSNVWSGNNIAFQSGAFFYFDPYYSTTQTVDQGYIQLAARKYQNSGQDDYGWYTAVTTLTKIANTRLYYTSTFEGPAWADSGLAFHGWAMISNSTAKGNGNTEYWTGSNSTWYSEFKNYGLNKNSTYLFVATSASNGQSIQPNGTGYLDGGYSALNSTQTIKTAVNGADANSKATITVTSYNLTGNGAISAQQSASISTGAKITTISAARTATTTLTVGSVATGYQFDGWYTAATGGTKLSASTTYTYYPTSATTVYARFSAKNYTITYNTNGGNSIAQNTYTIETATFDLPTPTKVGHTFAGWHDNASLTGNKVTQVVKGSTGNKTFYAAWTINKYTLEFGAGEGGSVTATVGGREISSPATLEYNTKVVLTASPSGENAFARWVDGNGNEKTTLNPCTITVTNNTVRKAEFNFPTTIYLEPSDDWKLHNARYAIYAWGGAIANPWVDMEEVGCEGEYYKANIPAGFTKFNIVRLQPGNGYDWNSDVWDQTSNLSVQTNGKNLYQIDDRSLQYIHLKPNDNWKSNDARFAAYFFSGTGGDVWVDMIENAQGVYSCKIPTGGHKKVLFGRMNPNTDNGFDWNNNQIWNKTKDLELLSEDNCFALSNEAWGNNELPADGEWFRLLDDSQWKTYSTPTYTVTIKPTIHGTYSVVCNGRTYPVSYKEDIVIPDVPMGTVLTIQDVKPGKETEYTSDIIYKESTNAEYQTLGGNQITVCGNTTIDENFVTKNAHVVYLRIPSGLDWRTGDNPKLSVYNKLTESYELTPMTEAPNASNYETGYTYYTCTIPAGTHTIRFEYNNQYQTHDFPHVMPLSSLNCYTIHSREGNTEVFNGYWSELLSNGDYRLLYVEQTVEKDANNKTIIKRRKAHPSDIIPASIISAGGSKVVSLHIFKDRTYTDAVKKYDGGTPTYYESNNNPEVILQQYNSSTNTWADVECHMVFGPLKTLPGMAMLPGRKNAGSGSDKDDFVYDDGIEKIKNDDHQVHPGSGVWNFTVVKQLEGNNATIDLTNVTRYTGEYYIRTDVANGGWFNYNPTNHMTRSDEAKANSNFSHYYCKWIKSENNVNVKFTVANDYGYAISDTLEADRTDLWGVALANKMVSDNQTLPTDANVRFAWNEYSNFIHRAYIAGSAVVSDRFLVLEGDANIFDADGNALKVSGLDNNQQIFRDNSNWIYYADVQMKPMAPVKVTAKYNGKTQYFIGKQTETVTLLQGSGSEKYLIRMLYDFKTNQLISAYVPGASNQVDVISTNIMVIRQDNKPAKQLNFTNGDMTTRSEDRRAYGVIEFTKGRLIDDELLNPYERSLYWISFPFDVDLSEVISFGEYGKHWIIQEYNGARRAAEGCWLESESFWDYKWDQKNITLEAGKGYVLALDVDQIRTDGLFGLAGNRPIGIYFPSTTAITNEITALVKVSTTVPPHECTINRGEGTLGDRRIKDSHWNVLGIPSYVTTTGTYNPTNIATVTDDLKYYYRWLGQYNKYEAETADQKEFQPMYAYMVQFTGQIDWNRLINENKSIAAKQSSDSEQEYHLRLELHQNGNKADHTFVQLQDEDGVTDYFDFNHDLCKIVNAGANIYTIIDKGPTSEEVAGNVMPIQETVIPVGVVISAAGEYTFAMPDGTDGIVVELIDYETNTRTNMLLDNYTVNLGKGTFENRFALHVQPSKVTTSVGEINTNTTGVKKYLIDGILYMQKDGVLYDAQGKLVR